MKLNEADKLKAEKQLSALVDYLLQSEDWKYVYLSECAEPIRLFMFKTGLRFKQIKNYLTRALLKEIGPIYVETQKELKHLAEKRGVLDAELMPTEDKPRVHRKAPKREHKASPNKPIDRTPSTEFGKKYKEHFGCSSIKNKEQYKHEYYYYRKHGVCSWEVEGE